MKLNELQIYFLGLSAIAFGAFGMDATGSMWPMAAGSSTGVMCSVPLVRRFLVRWRAAHRAR